MYFVLYDRFLKTIGETYVVESWSRTRRAVDFDDLSVVGEKIPQSANPFLVVVNDRKGKQMFSGLASTPIIDEKQKKTSISLKDYATMFNTEIIVNWGNFSGEFLSDYLSFVFETWLSQTDVGFPGILLDASNVSNIPLEHEYTVGTGIESVSMSSLIFGALNFYDLYYTTELSLSKKTITFCFCPAFQKTISIRLKDFNIDTVEKSFGAYNRVSVYDSLYNKVEEWALTEDNKVVKLPSKAPLLYPAKNRNFISQGEDISSARYDALVSLSGNRYQENIDLAVHANRSAVDLSTVDFSYGVDVYTEDGFYRNLPVGEIETDSAGKNIVRLGYRVQDLTQEI